MTIVITHQDSKDCRAFSQTLLLPLHLAQCVEHLIFTLELIFSLCHLVPIWL
jgi:hypothetical protein